MIEIAPLPRELRVSLAALGPGNAEINQRFCVEFSIENA